MELAALLGAMLGADLDARFCPLAPSPIAYRDNLGFVLKPGERTLTKGDQVVDARAAARLIDTTKAGEPTIGWLYLGGNGFSYVVLRPYARRDVYKWFGMSKHNFHWPDTYTEPVAVELRLPAGVEIASCVSDGPPSRSS